MTRPLDIQIDRRTAIVGSCTAGLALASRGLRAAPEAVRDASSAMRFGLVTYMWGADWDLPTLLDRCRTSGTAGVELRTTHKHGVEPSLSAAERRDVAGRFKDSGVALVGLGSDFRFDSPDAAKLAANIAGTKEFLVLSRDVGGSGVKVKPNDLPKDVPVEKTIAQIASALNEIGKFAANLGQEVRLEVHGQCAPLRIIRRIMDAADQRSVAVCWNCNPEDWAGAGLAHNFKLVRNRFGATLHVHELDSPKYPYAELFKLLAATKYAGWILLEASSKPTDRAKALIEQRKLFEKFTQTPR